MLGVILIPRILYGKDRAKTHLCWFLTSVANESSPNSNIEYKKSMLLKRSCMPKYYIGAYVSHLAWAEM